MTATCMALVWAHNCHLLLVCGEPATAMLRDPEGRVWHYCAACMERKADAPPPTSKEAS